MAWNIIQNLLQYGDWYLKVVRHWLPVGIMCNLGRDFGESEVIQFGIFLEEE